MALSNWATLAINEKGIPCRGVLNGFEGATLEIYKNWVYVGDSKMWTEGCGFTAPTIAQINEGNINLSKFNIVAGRTDTQVAVFVLATATHYPDKNDYSKKEIRILSGIGCSGYDDQIDKLAEFLGVNLAEYDDYNKGWASQGCYQDENGESCPDGYITLTVCKGEDCEDFPIPATDENEEKFGAKWVGVTPKLYAEFLTWLEKQIDEYDTDLKAWFEKVKTLNMNDVLNYNQGDAFFADHGVVGDDIGAKIGEPKQPIIESMI